MDPKMGTIDRNFKCETCGEAMAECPGHFGHIELARPVFHVGFLIKVKKIVECICVQCGRLKVDGEDPAIRQIVRRIPPKDRLKYIWDKAKSVSVCMQDDVKSEDDPNAGPVEPQGIQHHGCGHVQPVIRKEGLKLFVVYKKSKEEDDEVRLVSGVGSLMAHSEVVKGGEADAAFAPSLPTLTGHQDGPAR